jgi:hypothetical protein
MNAATNIAGKVPGQIIKKATQRHSRYGVNRYAIQHNVAFCKVAPFTRRARSVGQPLRALRVRRTGHYVLRPSTTARLVRCTVRAPASLAAALRRQSVEKQQKNKQLARRSAGVQGEMQPPAPLPEAYLFRWRQGTFAA